jgi:hypothetical protein
MFLPVGALISMSVVVFMLISVYQSTGQQVKQAQKKVRLYQAFSPRLRT